MNKHTKGIKRALEMQKWSNKRGGLPAGKDPFENGDAGVFDRRALCWFASMRQRGLAQGTINANRWALLHYRRWLLKNHRSSFQRLRTLLDRRRVEAFLRSVAEDASSTPQTQVRLVATLKRFCSWLANEKFLPSDLLSNLPSPKAKRRPLPRFLPLPVVIQLLEAPDISDPIGLRDRAILEVFYASGIRRNELRNLTLQDLDFHRTSIRIEKGKGDKQRIVPAGQRAFGWIRSYLETTRPLLAASKAPAAPLFVTGYGDAFSAGGIGHLVRRYLDQIGVAITGGPHLLRHSAATHMMDRGAGLRAIQRILGHSRLDTTAIYTHVSTQQLCEVHARCHPLGDQAASVNTQRSGSIETSRAQELQDLVD